MKKDVEFINKDLAVVAFIVSVFINKAGALSQTNAFLASYGVGYVLVLGKIIFNKKNNYLSEFKKYIVAPIAVLAISVLIQVAVKGFGEYNITMYKMIFDFLGNLFPDDSMKIYEIVIFAGISFDVAYYYTKNEVKRKEDIYEIFSIIFFTILVPNILYDDILFTTNSTLIKTFAIFVASIFVIITKKREVAAIAVITSFVIAVTYVIADECMGWNAIYIVFAEIIVMSYCNHMFSKSKSKK